MERDGAKVGQPQEGKRGRRRENKKYRGEKDCVVLKLVSLQVNVWAKPPGFGLQSVRPLNVKCIFHCLITALYPQKHSEALFKMDYISQRPGRKLFSWCCPFRDRRNPATELGDTISSQSATTFCA